MAATRALALALTVALIAPPALARAPVNPQIDYPGFAALTGDLACGHRAIAGLLAEARGIADGVDALLAKARSLHAGQEPSLTLVVDVMVPGEVTAHVLGEFRRMFPTCALTLRIEGLGAVAACVINGGSDLAIGGPVIGDQPALERNAKRRLQP